tara:strand:+ start:148 stop:255 length:108 start_codon:yes stop_codon:yes gene_type:complete
LWFRSGEAEAVVKAAVVKAAAVKARAAVVTEENGN